MSIKRRVFVDLDGTLAEWRLAASPLDLLKRGYFESLAPQPNVVEAIRLLNALDPEIEVYVLSAYMPVNPFAVEEKKAWVRKFLPELPESRQVYVPVGVSKSRYVHADDGDVLVDDYHPNLSSWRGRKVKLLNGVNSFNGRYVCVEAKASPYEIASAIRTA